MNFCIANWKMNFNIQESVNFIEELKKNNLENSTSKIILCPSFISLSKVKDFIFDSPIELGAQNVNQHSKGSFTGEVSIKMLQEIECEWVILGHSERRMYYSEEDVILNDKISTVLKSGLNPILCIGENINQKNNHETIPTLEHQLNMSLNNINNLEESNLIIAYEPVWAIGTGVSADIETISNNIKWIKEYLLQKFSINIPILYGGSVSSANCKDILKVDEVNGFLIGSSSLNVEEFYNIYLNLCER